MACAFQRTMKVDTKKAPTGPKHITEGLFLMTVSTKLQNTEEKLALKPSEQKTCTVIRNQTAWETSTTPGLAVTLFFLLIKLLTSLKHWTYSILYTRGLSVGKPDSQQDISPWWCEQTAQSLIGSTHRNIFAYFYAFFHFYVSGFAHQKKMRRMLAKSSTRQTLVEKPSLLPLLWISWYCGT